MQHYTGESSEGLSPAEDEGGEPLPADVIAAINKIEKAQEDGDAIAELAGMRELTIGIQKEQLKKDTKANKELIKLEEDYLERQTELDLMGSTEQAVRNYLEATKNGNEADQNRWGSVVSKKNPRIWDKISEKMGSSGAGSVTDAVRSGNSTSNHFRNLLKGGSEVTDAIASTGASPQTPTTSPQLPAGAPQIAQNGGSSSISESDIADLTQTVARMRQKGTDDAKILEILQTPQTINGQQQTLSPDQINRIMNPAQNAQSGAQLPPTGRSMRDILRGG